MLWVRQLLHRSPKSDIFVPIPSNSTAIQTLSEVGQATERWQFADLFQPVEGFDCPEMHTEMDPPFIRANEVVARFTGNSEQFITLLQQLKQRGIGDILNPTLSFISNLESTTALSARFRRTGLQYLRGTPYPCEGSLGLPDPTQLGVVTERDGRGRVTVQALSRSEVLDAEIPPQDGETELIYWILEGIVTEMVMPIETDLQAAVKSGDVITRSRVSVDEGGEYTGRTQSVTLRHPRRLPGNKLKVSYGVILPGVEAYILKMSLEKFETIKERQFILPKQLLEISI